MENYQTAGNQYNQNDVNMRQNNELYNYNQNLDQNDEF
jgi:hypothetical protein